MPLRVGNDVATIDDVMAVIEILSSRREYTKLNPDEYYCYEEEQKSEHEGNPFCDESHPYSIAHGGHPYDGNYGRLMNTRSAPPIDPVTGVSLGWNADQYNFMLIPFSASAARIKFDFW